MLQILPRIQKYVMIQELSSSTKNVDTLVSDFRGRNWRKRTRLKNKLRINMKVVLNSKFQKDLVTIVEDSLSDEDPQIVDIEHHRVDQTLEGISIEMEHISELPKEGHKDKGKKKISVLRWECVQSPQLWKN